MPAPRLLAALTATLLVLGLAALGAGGLLVGWALGRWSLWGLAVLAGVGLVGAWRSAYRGALARLMARHQERRWPPIPDPLPPPPRESRE